MKEVNRVISRIGMSLGAIAFGTSLFGGSFHVYSDETAAVGVIGKDAAVKLKYTLTVDGEVVDSTDGKEPFQYTHGKEQIIPGLEKQLEGLHTGDAKDVTVNP
ncbi:MAG: FKBP-type peptidyl-prolyl cis-trans isomerase, partial [Nitrososphaera sp.]|nr:FKBP-type peptidyl-prolyl cis-trans isomerase [Nitrososphaera sp.]